MFALKYPAYPQVTPEIQLGARGVMSFNVDRASGETASAVNDFSDSGPLVGFRQKLYNNFRGQLVIGFQFPDADSDLGQLFFHQVFLKIEDQSNILKMGRSRVRTALIEFPTLRDDDALHFTDVLNPFSAGENSEDNQYGNVLEGTHIFGQRYWLRLHGEHFTETPTAPGAAETDFSLNAIGLSFAYRVPASQRWNRPILDQVGISFNNFLTNRPGDFSEFEQALKNIIVSTVVNVKPNPMHFLDVRHQTIYNVGFGEFTELNEYADLARTKAIGTFTSLRYLYRSLERPTMQLALSFGYKTFPDLANATEQFQVVANGFYRLGENFDVGLQFQYQKFNGDLRGILGSNEARIQFALIYSIDQLWNNQFDDRDSLLNLEHGYIP
ncbi:hypothetical protein GWO43_24455 [candidate division KSB1 bacterium]|nr:hypothetical protein [candidate division KSB1 bacterium]NIR69050.1 hypothetical protein [candidate division KSB1 bacterium]NIS25618.1 hypothetical protein [candidate division KSB1 bacterium]NIT73968.1 hypothetical protein [candidate division KSB1 bacterium]NIU26295.1 hypothetical protein [candidate division KSB1 bacterium]